MIDWLTVLVPYSHIEPLKGGKIISIDPDENIEWTSVKKMPVRGSYESNLLLCSDESTRASDGSYTRLYIDGNFVKFHQGHNLFGTDDLTGLVSETFLKLVDLLGLELNDIDLHLLHKGAYQVLRADCTMMCDLGSLVNVEAFLYAAEYSAHMRRRGQGIMNKGTLYFGMYSKRWMLKMYAKGREIKSKGHQLHPAVSLPELQRWADGKLRIELVLRALELKRRKLHLAINWGDFTVFDSLQEILGGLEMTDNYNIPPELLEDLKPRFRAVYELWKQGHDLRAMYSRNTFYTYRRQLKDALNIDIAVKQPRKQELPDNVVPFIRVLEPKMCEQVPDWVKGTDLYFEPRALFK